MMRKAYVSLHLPPGSILYFKVKLRRVSVGRYLQDRYRLVRKHCHLLSRLPRGLG